MQPSWTFIRCVGTAALACASEQLPQRALHRKVPEVAGMLWEIWGKRISERERIIDLEGTARALGKVRSYIDLIVQDVAKGCTEELQKALIAYLSVVPSTVRMALRRPRDPRGLTVPNWLVPTEADDLSVFLPKAVPIYQPGDRPIPHVDWELTDLLGAGGFGEVWKAHNPAFQSVDPVVLKFSIDPDGGNKAFRHEAAIMTQAMPEKRHLGLVELRATYMNHEPPCLEFEYINGGDLVQWFKGRKRASGGLSTDACVRLVYHIARIVGYFHRRNPPIVHRDIKPANLLLYRPRPGKLVLKICDFGIGGLASSRQGVSIEETSARRLIGKTAMKGYHTPIYASPQQIKGGPPDPRDDVHALGVIWYQLLMNDLSLAPPNGTEWIKEFQAKHKLTDEQVELIANSFSTRSDQRPKSAARLAREIEKRFKPLLEARPRSKKGRGEHHRNGQGRSLVSRLKFWT